MKYYINSAVILFLVCFQLSAQQSQTIAPSDFDQITQTINYYFEGTSQDKPELIKKAFHPDLNLYSINQDGSLRTWTGSDYISNFKGGNPSNRIGKILSIDIENNTAQAKASIEYPDDRPYMFIDYFMMLKVEGQWKIVHKMYTRVSK